MGTNEKPRNSYHGERERMRETNLSAFVSRAVARNDRKVLLYRPLYGTLGEHLHINDVMPIWYKFYMFTQYDVQRVKVPELVLGWSRKYTVLVIR